MNETTNVGRLRENRPHLSLNCIVRFDRPFSSAKPRGSRLVWRFFTTERPITLPDRAFSGDNTSATDKQSRRVDTSRAVMLKPARLKMVRRPFDVTTASAVNHAGVTAKGVWLVASEPRDSKSSEPCPKETSDSSDGTTCSVGLLSATDLNRRNNQSKTTCA